MCVIEKGVSNSLVLSENECCVWSKLCDDLVVEILCRLPTENLIRCKCVCKFWNRVITDVCVPKISTFAPLRGFFYHGEYSYCCECRYNLKYASCDDQRASADEKVIESLSALLPFKFTFKDLLDSCNGLLLFVMDSVPQYYVCNPLTKQCIEIPRNIAREKAASDADEPLPSYAALAFSPCESSHFKVVCFNYWTTYSVNKTVNIDVFSSKTGEWVSHTMPLEAPIYGIPWIKCTVYLHGVLLRLSCAKYLLQLNLSQLNARAIELPGKETTNSAEFIGQSRDCLHYSNSSDSTLFIWFLEDNNKASRWVLKHSICINDIFRIKFDQPYFNKPWALEPNSEVIFFVFVNMILRYQVDNCMLEVVHSMRSGQTIGNYGGILSTYSPCMVILKVCSNASTELD